MRLLDKLMMRMKTLLRRGRAGEELDKELEFHLEAQIAENLAAGMTPQEARRAALKLFGNPALLREEARAAWSWGWLEIFASDMRLGVKRLARTPGFSLLAVLVMGLGIGANVALFTVVKSVLLNPLPFPDPGQLVRIYEADSHGAFSDSIVAGGSFARWQEQSKSFEQMAMKFPTRYDLADVGPNGSGGQLPEETLGELGSWNMFPMLGVQPAMGRLFTADDDRPEAGNTVVLTWGLWKRRYGGDRNVIGKTLLLDAKPYTVIGVLPAWFTYPDAQVQMWTPLSHERSRAGLAMFDAHNYDVVGRLKPGVTMAQANAELNIIQMEIRKEHPQGPVNDATSLQPMLEAETYKVKAGLYTLLAATGCLLLIACLNTANLLVARAATRRREIAVRTALGSSRARLVREQVTESVLLSCAGGGVGFLLAEMAVRWLVHTRQDIPRADAIHIDGMVILFATGLMLACGLLAGLIPARAANDRQILQALHESSRSHSGGRSGLRLRRVLLAAQVGLTVVLMVGAGLLVKSYQQMRSADLGCATDNVMTMRVRLPKGSYNSMQKMSAFYQQMVERVRAVPGVKAAGLVSFLPGEGHWQSDVFEIAEHPPLPTGKVLDASTEFADPGYFNAMQIPLVRGEIFCATQPTDPAQGAVGVVIDETLAREYFPGEDPVGKHIRSAVTDEMQTYTITGVVGSTLEEISGTPQPTIYFPTFMGAFRTTAIVARPQAGMDATTLAMPMQRAIAGIDAGLPVFRVLTMQQILGAMSIDASFDATLLAGFAVISLVLAGVGLFGVLSYTITQRTTEIGVRLALGSTRDEVLKLMLMDGLRPAVLGLVLGLVASLGVTRLIRAMLYATTGLDWTVFAAVSVFLLLAATAACLAPAWRASRLEPTVALRME
jgi:predicted permease